jgi:3-isopropylmalate/(R)-2-methylmalate dehydratase small subunit
LLLAAVQEGAPITVDLEAMVIARPGAAPIPFEVEAWRREALLNGWDEIDIIQQRSGPAIAAYEVRSRANWPWLFQGE